MISDLLIPSSDQSKYGGGSLQKRSTVHGNNGRDSWRQFARKRRGTQGWGVGNQLESRKDSISMSATISVVNHCNVRGRFVSILCLSKMNTVRKMSCREIDMENIWHDLPSELLYLQKYADEYGTLQFDDAIFDRLKRLDQSEIEELKQVSVFMVENWNLIEKYRETHPMTESESGKRLYFFGVFFAHGNELSIL
ncbi:MAG: hypothetical protein U0798_11960 [Gemmataceae bacterium]